MIDMGAGKRKSAPAIILALGFAWPGGIGNLVANNKGREVKLRSACSRQRSGTKVGDMQW